MGKCAKFKILYKEMRKIQELIKKIRREGRRRELKPTSRE